MPNEPAPPRTAEPLRWRLVELYCDACALVAPGLFLAVVIGVCLGLLPGLYTARSVTAHGCNPFLDQSAHGAPLCR
jgi:fumarate reductase subunit D